MRLLWILRLLFFLLFLTLGTNALAYYTMFDPEKSKTMDADTIFRYLEPINVYPQKGTGINYKKYTQLIAKIKKVYPVAKDAAIELEKYNKKFEGIKSEKERKKYLRKVEKELFARYESRLKHFSRSEGRYLMLLIDRETGVTSFKLIDELKGKLPAMFWQGLARLFGNDLKEAYDPVYKHYVIEQIVLMIERGEI